MSGERLIAMLEQNGADGNGIRNRFCGNSELFKRCFFEFLREPNFAALGAQMEKKQYEPAFDAAHALKGLSGNLGVTDFYQAICGLVESLRAKNYSKADVEYRSVLAEKEKLNALYALYDGENTGA